MIFGTAKDTNNIFYSTKNQVNGLCVGGDMVILFLSDPAVFTLTQIIGGGGVRGFIFYFSGRWPGDDWRFRWFCQFAEPGSQKIRQKRIRIYNDGCWRKVFF